MVTAVLFDRAMQAPVLNVELICPLSSKQTDYGKLVMLDYQTLHWNNKLNKFFNALFPTLRRFLFNHARISHQSDHGKVVTLFMKQLNKRF